MLNYEQTLLMKLRESPAYSVQRRDEPIQEFGALGEAPLDAYR
jgi:hypothetical protein